MAEERILDAAALITGNRWAYAYYVAGYAVECGLKSCVLARMIYTGGVFEDKKFADRCFTHDFAELVKLAGLTDELNSSLVASAAGSRAFVEHWTTAVQWQETARYQQKTEGDAKALYAAITHDPDGVISWIRNYW